jgi:hypothetical protein
VAGWSLIGATASGEPQRPTNDPGLKLLKEGRIDAAARLLGFGELGGASLVARAERAQADGNLPDALGFYQAYLQLFPFGYLNWEDFRQVEWSRAAVAYIELLAQTEKPDAEGFKQSLAALESYKQLRQAYARKNAMEYTRLTEEILGKYPHSIFAQAAVMTTCWGRDVCGHGGRFENGPQLLRAYLGKMDRLGIPEEKRLLVMLLYQKRLNHQQVTSGSKPLRVVSSADILRLSKNPFLRRAYLFSEMSDLMAAKNQLATRAMCRQYLDEFPAASQTRARLKLVSAYLKADDPGEAMWWIRQWPKADLPDALLAVADYYARKGQWEHAILYYEKIVQSNANRRITAHAKRRLARAISAQENNEQ